MNTRDRAILGSSDLEADYVNIVWNCPLRKPGLVTFATASWLAAKDAVEKAEV